MNAVLSHSLWVNHENLAAYMYYAFLKKNKNPHRYLLVVKFNCVYEGLFW